MSCFDDMPVVLPLNIRKKNPTAAAPIDSTLSDDKTAASVALALRGLNPGDQNLPTKPSPSSKTVGATPPSKSVSTPWSSPDPYAERAAEALIPYPTTPIRASSTTNIRGRKNSHDSSSARFVNKVRTFPRMAKGMFKTRENLTKTPTSVLPKRTLPGTPSPLPLYSKTPSPKSPLLPMCPTGPEAVSIGPIIQSEFFNYFEPMMRQALDAFLTDHKDLISSTSVQEEVRLWAQPVLGRSRQRVVGFGFPLLGQGRIIKANLSALKPVLGGAGHDVASTVKAWLKIIEVMVNGRTFTTPDWLLLSICQVCGKMMECIGDVYYNVVVAQKWTTRITTTIMGASTHDGDNKDETAEAPVSPVDTAKDDDSDAISLGSDYEESYAARVQAEKDLLRVLGIMGDSEAFGGNFDRVHLDTRSVATEVEEVELVDGKPPRRSFEKCMDYW
ncbi:hypothetical protein EDC01DRAFT_784436 [Geopyxis carbonaria]|nr:hypothetical protein EDC01DRAFT_784436 [Geopyxis carbonaria]